MNKIVPAIAVVLLTCFCFHSNSCFAEERQTGSSSEKPDLVSVIEPDGSQQEIAVNESTDTSETYVVDSGVCGENVTWTLDSEGTLTVSGNGDMFDYKFSPSPFKGLTIKKIVISEGVGWISCFVY